MHAGGVGRSLWVRLSFFVANILSEFWLTNVFSRERRSRQDIEQESSDDEDSSDDESEDN